MTALRKIQELRWGFLRGSPAPGGKAGGSVSLRYGLAIGFTAVALLVRWALDPAFHNCDPFPTFLVAVIGANWLGGLGPALTALVLGTFSGLWFFLPPRDGLFLHNAGQWFDLIAYLAVGLVIAFYGWARRRAEEGLSAEVQQRKATEEALRANIAEQKELDKLLRAAQSLLEQRVQERTAELQQSLRSMRDFTYSIAHNLFAPLRATHGFSELLLTHYGPQLDEPGRDFARRIAEAAARMSNLLESLLTYGRVASSAAPLTEVQTTEVVEEALRRVRGLPNGSHAQIQVETPLPAVHANAELLAEALFHLLRNAVQFVAPGVAPRVAIRAEARDGVVRLQIQDNGIGIDPAFHGDLFTAFSRLPHESTAGTGMGLAIVQKALDRMRGKLGLESQPGQGSSFWLELPRAA